jgi:hypothetical protein
VASEFPFIANPVGFGVSSSPNRKPIVNDSDDVSAVQKMLNRIPASQGGTAENPLDVGTEISGPNDPTVRAIRRFQQVQFGFQDGVVDPSQKTENRLHGIVDGQAPPNPPTPPTATKTSDFVIRIMGQDPAAPVAGQPTDEGQGGIAVPEVKDLRKFIESPDYLQTHESVTIINFNGGGGQRNRASDPTDTILNLLKSKRSAAASPGKVIVYGWSSGGRNSATLARKLVANDIAIDYLGIIDAAFDNAGDGERTAGVQATISHNFFEAVSNTIDPKFGFEFHGPVTGCQLNQSFDKLPFFQQRKAKFDKDINGTFVVSDRQRLKISTDFFDDVHKEAVQNGHALVQATILNLLNT